MKHQEKVLSNKKCGRTPVKVVCYGEFTIDFAMQYTCEGAL